ncbi:MAG: EF-hand domain-containing protein [Hyphomicrobium sp.]
MSTSTPITAGLLSSAYFSGQPQDLFSQLDVNGDGQISPDELSAFGQNLPGGSDASARRKNLFQKIDTNGDGTVTKDEWTAYQAERAKTRAALLQVQEQSGGVQGHHHRHHGGSGIRNSNPSAVFNQLDTNKDGVISADEWAAAYGTTGGVTVSSDVQTAGAQPASGVVDSLNSAVSTATTSVKNSVNSLLQTLNTLV